MRVERIGEGGRERERVEREEAREKLDRKEEEETLGMEGEGERWGGKAEMEKKKSEMLERKEVVGKKN